MELLTRIHAAIENGREYPMGLRRISYIRANWERPENIQQTYAWMSFEHEVLLPERDLGWRDYCAYIFIKPNQVEVLGTYTYRYLDGLIRVQKTLFNTYQKGCGTLLDSQTVRQFCHETGIMFALLDLNEWETTLPGTFYNS